MRLALAAATLVLLVVLRPRLGSTGFRRYARMTPSQVKTLFTTPVHDPDLVNGAAPTGGDGIEAEDLQVLSAIVDRKYHGLRLAVNLIGFAVAFIAFALVAGVIA